MFRAGEVKNLPNFCHVNPEILGEKCLLAVEKFGSIHAVEAAA